MKQIALITITLSALSTSVSHACDAESVAMASDILESVSKKFADGVETTVDLRRARKHLLDAKLCASEVSVDTYCGDAVAIQRDIVSGTLAAYKVGTAELTTSLSELNELNRLKSTCKSKD